VRAPSPDTPLLTIRGLSRSFGGREVVRSLDLELTPGDRVALRGPNGSGKTTILRCVTGTLIPSAGEVRVVDHPAGSPEAKRLVGASLSQERSFYLRLSGRENLLFFATLHHGDRGRAARQVSDLEEELELSQITAKRLDRCSSGMLQQVGFARALLGAPRLLLLDEPTRSLDRDAVRRLWAALDRRPDAAVLIATHHDDDLARCQASIDLRA
jgi:ABC-type multidrug transport system ATPase subunit